MSATTVFIQAEKLVAFIIPYAMMSGLLFALDDCTLHLIKKGQAKDKMSAGANPNM